VVKRSLTLADVKKVIVDEKSNKIILIAKRGNTKQIKVVRDKGIVDLLIYNGVIKLKDVVFMKNVKLQDIKKKYL